MLLQVQAQADVIGQRTERCHNLEASLRQLWERCSGLEEAFGVRTGEGGWKHMHVLRP